jgi:trans-aconitate 2-methyltransferase
LPEGDVIDLGCGSGAAGPALRSRFPGRRLIGVDASPAMLAVARESGAHDRLVGADVANWRPDRAPAVIFSNAVLQWLPDHAALIPRLAGLVTAGRLSRGADAAPVRCALAPPDPRGGGAAVPRAFRLDGVGGACGGTGGYARLLSPLGAAEVWETAYLQRLARLRRGHPVRLFTQSTAVRPVAERLDADERAAFLAAYDVALAEAYPAEPDGTVLMPFRRLFFVLAL